MKDRKIGLIGKHDDPEVQLLKARIEDLGAVATIIDFWHYPRFTFSEIDRNRLTYDGIDLMELDAFYLRQLGYFSPLPERQYTKDEWQQLYEKFNDEVANEREVLSYRESLIQILDHLKPVVNPYVCAFYHKLKLYQYWKLASQGVPVPDFIGGNDYFALSKRITESRMVLKPLTGGFVKMADRETFEAERERLRERPVIAQRQIKGKMLRTFVLNAEVIGTCQIVHEPSEVDARLNIVAIRGFDPPADLLSIPVAACRALSMIFAGVDLILEEPSNRLYVLECNPAPIFRSFEVQSGIPISRLLAEYLVKRAGLGK